MRTELYASESMDGLLEYAEEGDPVAQYIAAARYEFGFVDDETRKVVLPKPKEAKKWYPAAMKTFYGMAKQGDVRAQSFLAFAYHYNVGLDRDSKSDIAKAAKRFADAADKDDFGGLRKLFMVSENKVSRVYYIGRLGSFMRKRIGYQRMHTRDLLKLADAGNPEAQFLAGLRFEKSHWEKNDIVRIDSKKAEELYKKAANTLQKLAEHGDTDAQALLAYAYECGRGVEKNIATAIKWYGTAADGGSLEANGNLFRIQEMCMKSIAFSDFLKVNTSLEVVPDELKKDADTLYTVMAAMVTGPKRHLLLSAVAKIVPGVTG